LYYFSNSGECVCTAFVCRVHDQGYSFLNTRPIFLWIGCGSRLDIVMQLWNKSLPFLSVISCWVDIYKFSLCEQTDTSYLLFVHLWLLLASLAVGTMLLVDLVLQVCATDNWISMFFSLVLTSTWYIKCNNLFFVCCSMLSIAQRGFYLYIYLYVHGKSCTPLYSCTNLWQPKGWYTMKKRCTNVTFFSHKNENSI